MMTTIRFCVLAVATTVVFASCFSTVTGELQDHSPKKIPKIEWQCNVYEYDSQTPKYRHTLYRQSDCEWKLESRSNNDVGKKLAVPIDRAVRLSVFLTSPSVKQMPDYWSVKADRVYHIEWYDNNEKKHSLRVSRRYDDDLKSVDEEWWFLWREIRREVEDICLFGENLLIED